MTEHEQDQKIARFMGHVVIDVPFIPSQVPVNDPNVYFTNAAAREWRKVYPHGVSPQHIMHYMRDKNAAALALSQIMNHGHGVNANGLWTEYSKQLCQLLGIEPDQTPDIAIVWAVANASAYTLMQALLNVI